MTAPTTRTILVVLVAVTAVTYWTSVGSKFVNFDDPTYVITNLNIQQGLNWATLKWAFTEPYASNWHPLTWISLAVDFAMFGLSPMGYHVENLMLHGLCACLLYLALFKLTASVWRSAAVALVFTIHPLQVESVAWISERKNLLSAVFALGSLWCYSAYVKDGNKRAYIISIILFGTSLLSKSMVITFPFVLLLLDYWPLQRTKNRSRTALVKLWVEKIPFFALTGLVAIATYWAQAAGGAVRDFERYSFGVRIGNAILAYVAYLSKTIFPVGLTPYYPHPGADFSLPGAVLAAVILVVFSIGVWVTRRRFPHIFTGWFLFLGVLVPALGLVQVGGQAYADRYMYFPIIGLLIAAAWSIPDSAVRKPGQQRALAGFVGVLAVGLAVMTFFQVGHWKDSRTLYEHTLAINPTNSVAHGNLAHYLLSKNLAEEAEHHANQALEYDPTGSKPRIILGVIRLREGRLDEAKAQFLAAIESDPGELDGYLNLAYIAFSTGADPEGKAHIERYLELHKDVAKAQYNVANVYWGLQREEEALSHLRRALHERPDYKPARKLLSNLTYGENATPRGMQR